MKGWTTKHLKKAVNKKPKDPEFNPSGKDTEGLYPQKSGQVLEYKKIRDKTGFITERKLDNLQ